MRLLFMGTPDFAVPSLLALADDGHEIRLVVTQPDRRRGRSGHTVPSAVKRAALELALPVYQPRGLRKAEVRERLTGLGLDACVVVAYGKILPEWLLDEGRLGGINLHASLLPRYRGAAPINWAIAKGERESGVTTMRMVKELDAGDIYLQETIAIGARDRAPTLFARLAAAGAPLLCKTLRSLAYGKLDARPQDAALATRARMLKKEDGVVDWSRSAEAIDARRRGFDPWPGAFTGLGKLRLALCDTEPVPEESHDNPPGTILSAGKRGLLVACGEGTVLRIREVKPDGKRAMGIRSFLNGHSVLPGERFSPCG